MKYNGILFFENPILRSKVGISSSAMSITNIEGLMVCLSKIRIFMLGMVKSWQHITESKLFIGGLVRFP
jgi:hypothetical protein